MVKLHFRREGEGEPLVILHGLYGSSDNWLGVSRKLSSKYTVWAVDLRNHGRSPHHPEHTYKAMRDDLAAFFETHRLEPAVLLGHSMGGKVAMYFAADYPQMVKKLIVADIAPRDYLELEEESQYFLHRNILLALQEIDLSQYTERARVEERLAEKIGDPRIIGFLMKNTARDLHTHRLKWRLNAPALYDHLEEIVAGVNPRWLDDRIPITSYPVVFIRGLNSPYITDHDIPVIRTIYPEARIVDIPDAGHWLHAEQPELFLQAVAECC
ncbi:MAG TPA: alpha/beta fold hydrolase [Prolixibacteraceae bacterium]|jgi:pimeloyl-ACP methyl ester carboxylesterase|nr:alpha/beta fold hydrolase [Bacteroidales bacterium]HNQ36448.1 alpha/beta fold hydrolase [Prolixibacteraceae bacterium]HPJ78810.1 alpha/beta fold hydrolase [Prolixibacteraceae bacterium]HRV89502.1 alpha/beta fold hydrolase [Prolixibacteraceae bacterium]